MEVPVPKEYEEFVCDLVRSGRYLTPDEVVYDALHLLQNQEHVRNMRLEELREKIRVGWEQAERGELIDGEEVFRELRERSAKLRAQSGK